ncbi:dihydrofolate reductase family protein [Nonomuraea sp. NPDC051191]|uniref:dihydrofolate reductase family protein n=1 Tax=Nonomuraea sp. NPDC051191 TaxID=3364372 RepID=UPI0037AC7AAB
MSTIVSQLFVSLDGVVEAPEQWHFPYYDGEMAAAVSGQLDEADILLLGRRTYEVFAASWPARGGEVPFADRINSMPKLVASTTLTSPAWQNTTVIPGPVSGELAALKQGPDRHVTISGSLTLVRSLLRDNLLDELHLLIHPVVLGHGERLFAGSGPTPLRLVHSATFPTGVLHLIYHPGA